MLLGHCPGCTPIEKLTIIMLGALKLGIFIFADLIETLLINIILFNAIEFRCLIYAILFIPGVESGGQQKNSVGLRSAQHQRQHPAGEVFPAQTGAINTAAQPNSATRIWNKIIRKCEFRDDLQVFNCFCIWLSNINIYKFRLIFANFRSCSAR